MVSLVIAGNLFWIAIKMIRKEYWRAILGLALVVALSVLLWPDERKPGEAGEAGQRPRRLDTVLQVDADVKRDRNSRTAGERVEPVLTRHEPAQLGQFILPLVEGRQVTLRGAVKALMAAYNDACRRSRTVPLKLEFAYPAEEDEARLVFSIERGDFMGVLKRIALMAGYRVRMDGLQVAFEAIEDDGGFYTRTFRVGPDFKSRLEAELARLGISHGPSLGEILEALGVAPAGSEGAMVEINPTGQLVARMTQTELDRMEALVEGGTPVQLKVGVKVIRTPTALTLDPPPDLVELLVELAGIPGVQVTTMPSITTRESQPATIEIVKEEESGWTGTKVDVDGERTGLAILTRDTVQYRPDDHPKPYLQDTRYSVLSDGVPEISLVGEKDDEFMYRVLTAELIDATGRPIRDGGGEGGVQPVASPVPGSPGMVFSPFNNKVVDVRGLPPGTLVADPHYPAEEKKFFRVP